MKRTFVLRLTVLSNAQLHAIIKFACSKIHLTIFSFVTQVTFQLVLSSDGNASFAALTYKDPRAMKSLNEPVQVGFDAGDKTRGVNISPLSSAAPLQQVNVFRIDGTYMLIQLGWHFR